MIDNYSDILEKNMQIRRREDKALKELIKKKVDVYIYRYLHNEMRGYEYKDKMHEEILQELLDDL